MLQQGENIDNGLRSRYLNTVDNEKVFQRIGFEGPEYYNFDSPNPLVDCCPGKGYEDNHTDFIGNIKMQIQLAQLEKLSSIYYIQLQVLDYS